MSMHIGTPLIASALALGLPVFPCGPNKRPAISKKDGGKGFHDATTDVPTIERFFALQNAKLIGVPTGEASGFDVLDLDYRHGASAFEEANQHRIPATRVHRTRSGGKHFLFQHVPSVCNSAGVVAPGVDVRGTGGYMITPPSPGYEVIDDSPVAHWPDWLLQLVLPVPVEPRPCVAAGPRYPVSSKRIEALINIALDKVRSASDGQKHYILRNQAIVLGGLQHLGDFSDTEAVSWLMGALPSSAANRKTAEQTAEWGVATGKARPLELQERPLIGRGKRARSEPDQTEQPHVDPGGPRAGSEPPRPRKRPRSREHEPPGDRPLIRVIAGELHTAATAGEEALIRSGLAIYQRGKDLVQPVSKEAPASRGRMTLSAALSELTAYGLIDHFCASADWERFDARAEDWIRINPPTQVAQIVLARYGRWKVASIAGVITTPTLRPDGSVLTEPGYDPATRLYHVADPSLRLHPAVNNPTRAAAEGALAALRALLTEFPFVKTIRDGTSPLAVSEAVALSGMLTTIVRGAMPVAPLHAFNAHAPGSGKSYLVDVISMIASGRPCPVATASSEEVETEKRLAGLLLEGFPIVSIDNVNGELGGDLLCQAVERPIVRIRRLGGSDITEIETTATIFATGNNIRVRGDMVRRSLTAELDPEMERPELREFEANPVETIQADRGRYVSACLVIVRAYLAAGSPNRLSPIASFEVWSDLVRSALVWLGCADPVVSMETAREDDPELSQLREVVSAWNDAVGSDALNCRAVISLATSKMPKADSEGDYSPYTAASEPRFPAFAEILSQLAGFRGEISPARLGKWLSSKEGRIVGGRRFQKDGVTDGSVRWRLADVQTGRKG